MSLRSHPTRFFMLLFVLLGAAVGAGLYGLAGWPPIWSALCAANLVALGIWAWDKRQAVRGGWRVPEAALHAMAALGATPASFAAMLLFRHKLRKPGFWALYTTLTALQLAAVLYLSGRLPLGD
ncbi:MAG: DUF1294 domain-containing protein [Planctomycetes bacterium]|nr:DUF1294 domain-containing protein [Planctomycetota bacterium]MCB9902795.1 DUF1294 domain-containing protein [Planctomycetota bacterium]